MADIKTSGIPRALTWDDFPDRERAICREGDEEGTKICSNAKCRAIFNVTAAKGGIKKKDGKWQIVKLDLTVTFDDAESWKAVDWYNQASADVRAHLLEHEQVHYDIAPIRGRQAAEEIAQLTTEEKDTKKVVEFFQTKRTEIMDKWGDIMREDHVRYDDETSHGRNAEEQDRWEQEISQGRVPDAEPAK